VCLNTASLCTSPLPPTLPVLATRSSTVGSFGSACAMPTPTVLLLYVCGDRRRSVKQPHKRLPRSELTPLLCTSLKPMWLRCVLLWRRYGTCGRCVHGVFVSTTFSLFVSVPLDLAWSLWPHFVHRLRSVRRWRRSLRRSSR